MLKVRFETIALRVPVIDNSGEHDAKISQEEFDEIFETIERLEALTGSRRRWPGGDPSYASGGSSSLMVGGAPVSPKQQNVSQEDPVINTAVSDREMNSSGPELSLDEFRERPEKSRAPPRPRANSWRHNT